MKNGKWLVTRRELLKRMGAGAIMLDPILRQFHALAEGQGAPKRVIFLFTPNGTVWDEYVPGAGYTLKRILQPLEAYKDKMLVFEGLANRSVTSDPHFTGIGTILTNTKFKADPGPNNPNVFSAGISVDQYIANYLAGQTALRSIELGVGINVISGHGGRKVMNLKGDNQPIFPNDNPRTAFDSVFGSVASPPAGGSGDVLRAQKRSVLDFVASELSSLKTKLSTEENQKIDSHLDAVRDLERQLASPNNTCARPETVPANYDAAARRASANFPTITDNQIELIFQAMRCDLLRVASLVWEGGSGLISFPFAGAPSTHHGYSHAEPAGANHREAMILIQRWYAEKVALLVRKLHETPEGNGTMLDNTLILWVNEINGIQDHNTDKLPIVMLGNLNNYFQMGRHMRYTTRSHAGLLVSICNAMGININSFGDASISTGPMPNIKKV